MAALSNNDDKKLKRIHTKQKCESAFRRSSIKKYVDVQVNINDKFR